MLELSKGKDTTTGHWELCGLLLDRPFPTYPDGFPPEVVGAIAQGIGRGLLGNRAASGTAILEALGPRHLETGEPILYTSADSVLQLAAHEALVPRGQLYEFCRVARGVLTGEHAVGRVIARPFVGRPGEFRRTGGRRDFSLEPTGETLLDLLVRSGQEVTGVGKIGDIFAHRGLTLELPASGNAACIEATLTRLAQQPGGLIFANLNDFDSVYGHRNDPAGYRRALEDFDRALPAILAALGPEDLLILTADHGCDPTTESTDHSREYVPLLLWSPAMDGGAALGTLRGFSTVAATVAEWLGVAPQAPYEGESVLDRCRFGGAG